MYDDKDVWPIKRRVSSRVHEDRRRAQVGPVHPLSRVWLPAHLHERRLRRRAVPGEAESIRPLGEDAAPPPRGTLI